MKTNPNQEQAMKHTRLARIGAFFLLAGFPLASAQAQVSYDTIGDPITEDFDSGLPSSADNFTWTDDSVFDGWYAYQLDTSALRRNTGARAAIPPSPRYSSGGTVPLLPTVPSARNRTTRRAAFSGVFESRTTRVSVSRRSKLGTPASSGTKAAPPRTINWSSPTRWEIRPTFPPEVGTTSPLSPSTHRKTVGPIRISTETSPPTGSVRA